MSAPNIDYEGDIASFDIPGLTAVRLVWVNGVFRADLSDQADGLTLAQDAVDLDWVAPEIDGLAAANLAAGQLVELAVSDALQMPVHCLFIAEGEDQAAQPRLQWRVAANAQLELLEQHVGEGANLVNMVSQFDLAADSKVTRYKLLNTKNATHTGHTWAQVRAMRTSKITSSIWAANSIATRSVFS